MLELRPVCENCTIPLPPESTGARICSFECTFCADCADGVLGNVCPNCGGGFVPRPVRPARDWRNGNCTANYPPATRVVVKPVDAVAHGEFARDIRPIAPERR